MANEKEQERDIITVAMGRDLAGLVRTIAAHRNMTMVEVWEKHARPGVLKEYKRVLEDMQLVVTGDPGA